MTKTELLAKIVTDLGDNYRSTDSAVLSDILDEVVDNALVISNRKHKVVDDTTLGQQIDALVIEIKQAVKSIYLLRGAEDVTLNTVTSGFSSTFKDPMEELRKNIIYDGKRLLV